jgi:hypothetical protein
VLFSKDARAEIMKKEFNSKLKLYKNEPELFMKAIEETLEADVRSKFQTKRRMEDSKKSVLVEV